MYSRGLSFHWSSAFIPVPTSLGLCIGMLFIHGLGFAAQLVAAFSSAHSEALIAGKAFKIVTR